MCVCVCVFSPGRASCRHFASEPFHTMKRQKKTFICKMSACSDGTWQEKKCNWWRKFDFSFNTFVRSVGPFHCILKIRLHPIWINPSFPLNRRVTYTSGPELLLWGHESINVTTLLRIRKYVKGPRMEAFGGPEKIVCILPDLWRPSKFFVQKPGEGLKSPTPEVQASSSLSEDLLKMGAGGGGLKQKPDKNEKLDFRPSWHL